MMRSSNCAPLPTSFAASTERTTISLIEAMIPTSRNGSARSSRFSTVVRTANSSSTTMNTSSRMSSRSRIGCSEKSEARPNVVFPASTRQTSAVPTRKVAMPA